MVDCIHARPYLHQQILDRSDTKHVINGLIRKMS
jgi:hypothetical protein